MKNKYKQKGIAALLITMTVLAILTIITLFTARVIMTDTKIFKNVKDNAIALNAAQSGFDYALGYLNTYPYIVANGLGYCASASNTYALPSGTLANNATYTMTFSCITAGNFVTFTLSAVGTSQDGSAVRTVQATLKQYCGIAQPLISRDDSELNGNTTISSTVSGITSAIDTGGSVDLGNSTSVTANGVTCAGSYDSPPSTSCQSIRSSNATPTTAALASISNANYQQLYLGRAISAFSPLATVYRITCAGGSNRTFNQLSTFAAPAVGNPCSNAGTGGTGAFSGITNAIIYMNMNGRSITLTTTNGGKFSLGTVSAPVILVIDNARNVTFDPSNAAGSSLIIDGNVYTSGTSGTVTVRQSGGSSITQIKGILYGDRPVNIQNGSSSAQNGSGVDGAIISNGTTLNNNSSLMYSAAGAANISKTIGGYCGGAYAIVAGSWRDF